MPYLNMFIHKSNTIYGFILQFFLYKTLIYVQISFKFDAGAYIYVLSNIAGDYFHLLLI